MTILRVLLVASLTTHVTGTSPDDRRQSQQFRPVSLGDLVKAVGANRDGLEGDVDLTPFVADHAIFMGEAVGVAARFRDDSDGSIFVGWRWPGELWRYRFLDDRQLDGIRSGAGVRLGRVEGLRALGVHLVLETRVPSSVVSSVVMQRDLAPVAHVAGSAKLALSSGMIVLYDASRAELAILDPATPQVTTFYAPRPASRAGVVPAVASIASLQHDEQTDTLSFTVTFASETPETVIVRCRPISRPARACAEARERRPAATGQ